jgi:hypothetical protein
MTDSTRGSATEGEPTNPSAAANEATALNELHAAAQARTKLLLTLFPQDAGASVLPSAESTLYLPDMVTVSVEGSGDPVTVWEIKTRSADQPDASSQAWNQLMTYVDTLTKAVQSEDRSATDRSRAEELGSEQPIPG